MLISWWVFLGCLETSAEQVRTLDLDADDAQPPRPPAQTPGRSARKTTGSFGAIRDSSLERPFLSTIAKTMQYM